MRIIIAVFVFMLAGCASMSGNTVSSTEPAVSLVKSNSNMSDDDKRKLQEIVNTAKTDESVTWDGYEFTSQKIYVNSKGQPCREYTVASTSIFSGKGTQQTACRDNKGVWRLVG